MPLAIQIAVKMAAHIVNKDMAKKGWVKYDYHFGSYLSPRAKTAGIK